MTHRPFQAVIFDLNGTIIDDSAFHAEAWLEFCSAHGMKLTEEAFNLNIMGRPNNEIFRYVFRSDLSEEQIVRYADEKEARYRELYAPHRSTLPGVREFLDDLKRECVPTALATSSPPVNLPFILDDMDLRKYFQVIVDASHVQKGKPDPEIYIAAADRLGISPIDCLVFEDSLFGVDAAMAAGMQVVAVSTTHSEFADGISVMDDFTGLSLSF